ncbi:Bifunctional 3'-phosphoadenosine 5'-phosphosulfate synthase 2 [Dirofilaria immitis]|nr:Bifunctional 3'-phosphoadenosine 5'-phosphosulfate synthase 2 [Dirofilaria immitis]
MNFRHLVSLNVWVVLMMRFSYAEHKCVWVHGTVRCHRDPSRNLNVEVRVYDRDGLSIAKIVDPDDLMGDEQVCVRSYKKDCAEHRRLFVVLASTIRGEIKQSVRFTGNLLSTHTLNLTFTNEDGSFQLDGCGEDIDWIPGIPNNPEPYLQILHYCKSEMGEIIRLPPFRTFVPKTYEMGIINLDSPIQISLAKTILSLPAFCLRHLPLYLDSFPTAIFNSIRMRIGPFLDLQDYGIGATNVTFQQHKIGREERARILGRHIGFRGCTIWFTGLSGAGKTTVAFAVEKILTQLGVPAYALDGDNVRHGLCRNLGFSKEERRENIRRVAEVAKLFADMGIVALASFISPYKCDRDDARSIHNQDNLAFFEVYVNTPLKICELRDPKNLYKKARAGELKGFTGIDSVYEAPEKPDLILESGIESEAESVRKNVLPVKAYQQISGPPIRELYIDEESKDKLLKRVNSLPKVQLTKIDLEWLQVLAEGWASPLPGFMRERQYLQCLHHEDIEEDSLWSLNEPLNQSIPIVLPIDDDTKIKLMDGHSTSPEIALVYNNEMVAVVRDGEIFEHRKEERVARQFGLVDPRHPAIKQILESGSWLLGGDVQVLKRIQYNDGLDCYRMSPLELRNIFAKANCDAVFAFQLRNPIHNGHALLMQNTREQLLTKYKNPMLLLHPLGGWTKEDDVPLDVRMKQYDAVLSEGVLDPKWTVLAIFPSPMLYAGPTEVQWHARARLAAGVSTYIVGRDPAGIQHPETGDYLYDPTHGSKVLSMAPGLPNLDVILGTKMRSYARDGIEPPEGFMTPKAWKNIADSVILLSGIGNEAKWK